MSKLVIEVSAHTRSYQISVLLFYASMTLAAIASLHIRSVITTELHSGIFFIVLTFPMLLILSRLISPFIKVSNLPETILTITADGIHALKTNGKAQSTKWSEMACVDIFDHGPVKSLRIAPTNFAFKEMLYEERHLTYSCEEIIKFVHDVCPYGKDISFWNENRN